MNTQVKVHYSSKKDPGFALEIDIDTCLQEFTALNVLDGFLQIEFPSRMMINFCFAGTEDFWMEIYEFGRLSAAMVDLSLAKEVVNAAARDFDGKRAEECLSHLRIKWDYICGG